MATPRARRRRERAPEPAAAVRPDINVTPLVDVVLVLLIIFMVVTPMLSRGVDVRLPETVHHAEENDTGAQIVVSVRADGQVFLDRDPVPRATLAALLGEALRRAPGRPIFVKADERLRYREVREVMELCHQAGARQVALGTTERAREVR